MKCQTLITHLSHLSGQEFFCLLSLQEEREWLHVEGDGPLEERAFQGLQGCQATLGQTLILGSESSREGPGDSEKNLRVVVVEVNLVAG